MWRYAIIGFIFGPVHAGMIAQALIGGLVDEYREFTVKQKRLYFMLRPIVWFILHLFVLPVWCICLASINELPDHGEQNEMTRVSMIVAVAFTNFYFVYALVNVIRFSWNDRTMYDW